jgi:hypothetical protein
MLELQVEDAAIVLGECFDFSEATLKRLGRFLQRRPNRTALGHDDIGAEMVPTWYEKDRGKANCEADDEAEADEEGKAAMKSKKPRHDLREFWPWYERSWRPWTLFPTTPPPFEMSDLRKQSDLLPQPWRLVAQIACVSTSLALLMFMAWALFH